jgi:hypothetical protein
VTHSLFLKNARPKKESKISSKIEKNIRRKYFNITKRKFSFKRMRAVILSNCNRGYSPP